MRRPDPDAHIAAGIAYQHDEGDPEHCAVIGGYAYRGDAALPQGTYLYADYCSGTIWAVPVDELTGGAAVPTMAGRLDPAYGQLQSFGEDDDGELYLLTSGGHILHIVDSRS